MIFSDRLLYSLRYIDKLIFNFKPSTLNYKPIKEEFFMNKNLRELVDRILEDKKITKAEAEELQKALTEDGEISEEGYEEIDRILRLFDSGEIEEVDE